MRRPRLVLLATLAVLVLGCPKSPEAVRPHYSGPPKSFKLLSETPEAETSTRLEKRADLLVTVENGEPIPAVIAVGETPPLSRQGGTLRLFGDAEGRQGWSVDNFVLLEVINKKGEVLHRAAIGFQQGCSRGSEVIDALGQMKFAFGPGEIELSNLLPIDEQVTVRATALDTGGVGKVSDLYMILTAEVGGGGQDEDMREK